MKQKKRNLRREFIFMVESHNLKAKKTLLALVEYELYQLEFRLISELEFYLIICMRETQLK